MDSKGRTSCLPSAQSLIASKFRQVCTTSMISFVFPFVRFLLNVKGATLELHFYHQRTITVALARRLP